MAELTSEQQLFLVRELACFGTPSVVASQFRDEFGQKLDRQQVQYYNAARSKKLDPELAEAFWKIRQELLDGLTEIGIANKYVRLQRLERLADQAEEQGNFGLVKDLLEQAAKEVGNRYTNRTELTGAGGGAIAVEVVPIVTDYRQAAAGLAPPPDAEGAPLPLPELDEAEAGEEEAQVLDDELPDAESDYTDAFPNEAAIDGTDRF